MRPFPASYRHTIPYLRIIVCVCDIIRAVISSVYRLRSCLSLANLAMLRLSSVQMFIGRDSGLGTRFDGKVRNATVKSSVDDTIKKSQNCRGI